MKRVHFQKYVEPLFALFFLVSIAAIAHEIDWLENTLGGLRLFWMAFVGGGLLGMACAARFAHTHHELLSGMCGPVLRSLLFIGEVTLTAGFASGAAASFVNRSYAGEAHTLTVTVTDKFIKKGQARAPHLVIQLDTGAQEYVQVDRLFWDDVPPGEQVALRLCRGALGYDSIRAWSLPASADSAGSNCED